MASFTPSPAELALVSSIFTKADPQKIGILTGDAALKVFGGAKLPPTVLGEIWSIADEDNNGWLPKKGVAIAVRLMGWAQKGEKVTPALINRPGPLPNIEGIQAPLVQQSTGMSIPKSPPPGLPALTPQDKTKFMGIFQGCKPVNGLITGDKARDLFVKSKLPVEKLGQIWNLADTQNRGTLDSTDFIIGMYLIQASMSGQLSFIPSSLPPGLYEQAGGSGNIISHATGGSGSFSPSTGSFNRMPMQPQYTGQSAMMTPQMTGVQKRAPPTLPVRKPTAPLQAPMSTGGSPFTSAASPFTHPQPAWDVTANEKASADQFFDTLDSHRVNYIEGDVAVPFMLQSKLPEDVLAQVWDLADINNDGRLTRDGFAVAMHLIQGKLAGKAVPTILPPSLIPPSMRANGTSQFSAPPMQQPQESVNLLWDDTPPPSASPPPQQLPSTSFAPAMPPRQMTAQTNQDPFGSSSFYAASPNLNFLDDDEPAASSPPLQDQSAEIGNVQNQLNSTNRSLSQAKTEREPLEQTLANQAAQLSALQTQLASAKAAYETETKLLGTLRDRLNAQNLEMQKARQELISAESDLSGVRVEKSEIEGAFMRDKEDVRELHRKMAETGTQVAGLKLEIEKAKKEAKQQKGLLAIARKQLSTKEVEKAKVAKELEDAQTEVKEAIVEREAAEAEFVRDPAGEAPSAFEEGTQSPAVAAAEGGAFATAIAQPLPAFSPIIDPTSPSGSSIKSNNPFDRLTKSSSTASTPRSSSPFLPFAETSTVPTPSVAPVSAEADPFGFSDAFGENAVAEGSTGVQAPEVATTPRAEPAVLPGVFETNEENPVSPTSAGGSDFFSTPPSTGVGLPHSPGHQREATETHFPPLENVPGSFPVEEAQGTETDLGSNLMELEADESDSDDEEPLATVRHKLQASTDSTPIKSMPETNGASAPASSFDDAFGDSNSEPEWTNISTPKPSTISGTDSLGSSFTAVPNAADAFSAPTTHSKNPFPSLSTEQEPHIAGVNAFDEAMGKIPTGGAPSPVANFSFDSAFEDNFDFASVSAGNPAFPPVSSGSTFPPVSNGSAFPPPPSVSSGNPPRSPLLTKPGDVDNIYGVSAKAKAPALSSVEAAKSFSFEDAFTSPISAPANAGAALSSRQGSGNPAAAISFDDAFGGEDSSQALKLDNNFGSVSSRASAAFSPAQSAPQSPQGGPTSPRLSSVRSATPPRSMSPPLRQGSPGPRVSTSSSSKDGHEKIKEPTTRSSRLSIRLPFGKKRSKQEVPAMPLPSSQLSQTLSPVQEPTGAATPAVEDDVDSVKQLCGMGFSRTQAVAALEAHGYDVQKALNSLLGAQ